MSTSISNPSDDIQAAGFDTHPPMLDRTDYESWAQRIRLYCQGKELGKNILRSIDEEPVQMGTSRMGIMFLLCVHLVSWEKENVSSEVLDAARIACNKYMTKFTGKDAFLPRIGVYSVHILCINKMLSYT